MIIQFLSSLRTTEPQVVDKFSTQECVVKKGSEYDGGHRVPFFVHWPNGGMDKLKKVDTLWPCGGCWPQPFLS